MRQHNVLLIAAGFAPIWQETEFGAPELKEVRQALDYILSQQEPFPAAAGRWNLLQANDGAVRLVEFPVGPLAPDAKVNLADALVAPDLLAAIPHQLGGCRVLLHPQRRSRRARRRHRRDRRAARSPHALQGCVRDAADARFRSRRRRGGTGAAHALPQGRRVARPLHDDRDARNAPDIALQELRIESFFPMDGATARVLRAWVKPKRTHS